MAATLNIESFRQTVAPGFQKLNKFVVRFPIPIVLGQLAAPGSQYYNTLSNMEFYADQAQLVGAGMTTVNIIRYGYGVSEKAPFAPLFNDIAIGFYNDVQSLNLTFFQTWVNYVNAFNMTQGVAGIVPGTTTVSPYETYYKDEFAVDFSVTLLSDHGEEVGSWTMRKAFPLQIGETQLAWVQKDIMRFVVYFNYMDWYFTPSLEVFPPLQISPQGIPTSPFQTVPQISTNLENIAPIGTPVTFFGG